MVDVRVADPGVVARCEYPSPRFLSAYLGESLLRWAWPLEQAPPGPTVLLVERSGSTTWGRCPEQHRDLRRRAGVFERGVLRPICRPPDTARRHAGVDDLSPPSSTSFTRTADPRHDQHTASGLGKWVSGLVGNEPRKRTLAPHAAFRIPRIPTTEVLPMEPLYVVELDVTPADASFTIADVRRKVLEHCASWLCRDSTPQLSAEDLLEGGQITQAIVARDYAGTRELAWSSEHVSSVAMTSIVTWHDVDRGSGSTFQCHVSIYSDDRLVACRVVMGRASRPGMITPVPISVLRRPRLLRLLAADRSLICRVDGQVVDGRYVSVSPDAAGLLGEVISRSSRLPMLLTDSSSRVAREFAAAAARELIGLVRVVSISGATAASIDASLPDIDVALPLGGARLVWPDMGARHPHYNSEQLQRRISTISSIVRLVAPLSVVARGRNVLARRVADARRQLQEQQFMVALEEAASTGDAVAKIATLEDRVAQLTSEMNGWLAEVERLEAEVQTLRAASRDGDYWKSLALSAQSSRPTPSGDRWSDAPALESGDLGPLAEFLSRVSGGALVFTPAASRSWRRDAYPYPDSMREALIALAQAAVEWRNADCTTGGILLDDWLYTRWGMRASGTDKGLVRAGADRFDFEGSQYSREPHLKLDDHTTPNEVGRVYFALDKDHSRFIVDHVGLKLYGL